MRYVGQEHAVTVDLDERFFREQDRRGIKGQFDEVHAVRYGTSAPKEPGDIVSLRLTVTGLMKKPSPRTVPEGGKAPEKDALLRKKPVYFRDAGGFVDTPVYRRTLLRSGNEIAGPALIEEHASTTVLAPGDRLAVDAFGNLVIAIGSQT